jgi:hypothetical protein
MLKIDASLLQEIGLGTLPDTEKNSLLRHIYETLEMRVGIRLADQMSNEQLDEFERYFEAKDDAGAFKWLETNFPNYKDIVQEEFDKLKAEVTQSAPQILSASQAQPADQVGEGAAIPQPDSNQSQAPSANPQPYTSQDQAVPQQAPLPSPSYAAPQGSSSPEPVAPAYPDNLQFPQSVPPQPDPYQIPVPVPVQAPVSMPTPQQPYQPQQPTAPWQPSVGPTPPMPINPMSSSPPQAPYQPPMPSQPNSPPAQEYYTQPPYPSEQPPAGPTSYSDSNAS